MQQTEQDRVRRPEPSAKQHERQNDRPRPDADARLLTLAVQSLAAGLPVQSLPAPLALALAGQIGNSALLELVDGQSRGPDTVSLYPPPQPTGCAPLDVQTAAPDMAAPPDWAALPAAQTAPAPPAALGGEALAGG